VVNGIIIGWREAYDVAIHITSPADTTSPVAAWALSLSGWLIVPGLAGAVAGYVVSNSIYSRRQTPLTELFEVEDDQ
jgi:hypothetical protein